MDEYRVCTDRYKEHLSSIRDSDYNDDKKYAFMSRNGGPGAWIFIPYIFSHIPVKKQILLTLESREIQLYPQHLNKEQRWRRKMVNKGRPVNPTHAARAAYLPRANWNNRGATPVRLQLMSRFWVEKGARKHRKNMSFFLAKHYAPGLKSRLR